MSERNSPTAHLKAANASQRATPISRLSQTTPNATKYDDAFLDEVDTVAYQKVQKEKARHEEHQRAEETR